jgi:hypothetical protein
VNVRSVIQLAKTSQGTQKFRIVSYSTILPYYLISCRNFRIICHKCCPGGCAGLISGAAVALNTLRDRNQP